MTRGKHLGTGASAVIELLPSGRVTKTPIPNPFCRAEEEDHRQNMRIEARVYQALGEHACLPKMYDWEPDTCRLTLEYMENGDIGEYVREHRDEISPEIRLRWAIQAAEGVSVVHSAGVLHCDISPRNFLLDSKLNLRISDFGGASLDGAEPTAEPGERFRPGSFDWRSPPTTKDDLFGLGSLIYFIATNTYPYEEIPSDEVVKLYEVRQFPNVEDLVCGSVIQQCWLGEADSAKLVHSKLRTLEATQAQ